MLRVSASVELGGLTDLANPKSINLTPVLVSMMLPGFNSMDHSPAMRLFQCDADGSPISEDVVERQRAFEQAVGQRLALEIFHYQIADVVLLAHIVEVTDVGMIQRRDALCFALETLFRCGLLSFADGQDLDCNRALQPRIPCSVHFAHSACAWKCKNLVRTECSTSTEGQDTSGCCLRLGPNHGQTGSNPPAQKRLVGEEPRLLTLSGVAVEKPLH